MVSSIASKTFLTVAALTCFAMSTSFAETEVDNTKVNQRDRAENQVTADQQSNATSDVEITRLIRRKLIDEKDLSTYAHNIKIITLKGMVTLKGPVRSASEKSEAEAVAKSVAGVSAVNNQLSIKQ